MQSAHQGRLGAGRCDEEAIAAYRLDEDERLAPLLAGARARGMADAFEMLGVAAILIDQSGGVLHAGSTARQLLGADIAIVGEHLVGSTAAANRALQQLIVAALSGEGGAAAKPVVLSRKGRPSLVVRALTVPGAERDPMQLLKVIIVLTEAGSAASAEARRVAADAAFD
jgi:hypothetical protein